jgi:hypothetical protein
VSSNNILPVDVSIVDGVATLALKYANADAPLDITVVALGNSAGRESAASTAQTLIAVFDAPVLSGSISYSGTTASMTYNVASGVDAVQVRKASDGSVMSGAITSVSGTIATITVPLSNTTDIVVVALVNSTGRESAASASQTLLKQFAAPVKASEPVYTTVSAGSYTASMTYTVAAGVTQVLVTKASDIGYVFSNIVVSGTTVTITVPFT